MQEEKEIQAEQPAPAMWEEKEILAERPAPAMREPAVPALPRRADKASIEAIANALLAEFSNQNLPPPTPPAIDPAPPPADQPLEPGSGAPRLATHPGVRIAASEAALGVARPSAAVGAKSDFIAAARRAAQAAGQDPKGRQARSESFKMKDEEAERPKVMTRVKSMVLAASIVAIIIGSIQFASNLFDFRIFDTNEAKLVSSPARGYSQQRDRGGNRSNLKHPPRSPTANRRHRSRRQPRRLMPTSPHLCWRPRRCQVRHRPHRHPRPSLRPSSHH